MAYQFHNLKVLVVEDNQPMLDLVKSLLEAYGVGSVYTANNGQSGFRKFCECDPDLVIADWMMKPVNGIEFAEIIRNDKRSPNPYVPYILMTGFSEKERVLKARDVGVTEFIVKPFSARDLYKRIAQVIEKPRQFVKADGFFGPDRRRRGAQPYDGELKRSTDLRPEDYEIDLEFKRRLYDD